jgi:spore germination protein GerM
MVRELLAFATTGKLRMPYRDSGLVNKKPKKMVRRSGRHTKKAKAQKRHATIRAAVIIAVILIAAAGIWYWRTRPTIEIWSPAEPGEQIFITLYFPDSTDTFLIPVQRKIKIGRAENRYLRALKELRLGPYEDTANLRGALPPKCNILSVEVAGKTARADFNQYTLELLDETSEKWFYKSIVHTLCEFDEIDRVEFSFEGRHIKALPQGTDVSQPRTPGDINLSFAPVPDGATDKITVYFPDLSGRYIVPITEIIPKPASKNGLVSAAMRRLLDGPISVDKEYLKPLFKKDVKVKINDPGGIVEEGKRLKLAFEIPDPKSAFTVDYERAISALRLTFEKLLSFNEFDVIINGQSASDVLGLPFKVNDINPHGLLNPLPEPTQTGKPEDAKGGPGAE